MLCIGGAVCTGSDDLSRGEEEEEEEGKSPGCAQRWWRSVHRERLPEGRRRRWRVSHQVVLCIGGAVRTGSDDLSRGSRGQQERKERGRGEEGVMSRTGGRIRAGQEEL